MTPCQSYITFSLDVHTSYAVAQGVLCLVRTVKLSVFLGFGLQLLGQRHGYKEEVGSEKETDTSEKHVRQLKTKGKIVHTEVCLL